MCDESNYINIYFNENDKKKPKIISPVKQTERDIKAKVYIEELDEEIERLIKWTPLEIIFDLSRNDSDLEKTKSSKCTEVNCHEKQPVEKSEPFSSNEKVSNCNEKKPDDTILSEDDLMNEAIGCQKNDSMSEKRASKRKGILLEDKPVEKKSKTGNPQELLKKVDVDQFLDKLHGEN